MTRVDETICWWGGTRDSSASCDVLGPGTEARRQKNAGKAVADSESSHLRHSHKFISRASATGKLRDSDEPSFQINNHLAAFVSRIATTSLQLNRILSASWLTCGTENGLQPHATKSHLTNTTEIPFPAILRFKLFTAGWPC